MSTKITILLFTFLFLVNTILSRDYYWDHVLTITKNEINNVIFKGIAKSDSLNIIAVMEKSDKGLFTHIIKSKDGGVSWSTVFDSSLSNLRPTNIAYPSKDLCIVTLEKNNYLRSTDDGNSWELKKIIAEDVVPGLIKIDMLNSHFGIMSSLYGLFFSNDGFETSVKIQTPLNATIRGVQLIDTNTIYLLLYYNWGRYGNGTSDVSFYKTSDRGITWEELSQIKYLKFFGHNMKFLDSRIGFIVGERQLQSGEPRQDIIYRTTDGGKSWRNELDTVLPWLAYGLQNISMLDRKHAIVTGQFGIVYWTHDGGKYWELDSNALILSHIPATLYPCIIGENTAIIVDFWTRIFRSSLKPISSIENDFRSNNLISPNPATDYITINIGPSEGWSVELYNMMGVLIQTTPSLRDTPPQDGNLRIEVSNLSPGVYFVKIGGRVERFVKM